MRSKKTQVVHAIMAWALAIVMVLTVIGPLDAQAAATSPYSDVQTSNALFGAINTGFKEGWLGYDYAHTSKFMPSAAITRQDFVIWLGKSAGVNPDDYKHINYFEDTTNPYVNWAREMSITSLSSSGSTLFRPNETMTREQMISLVKNYVVNYLEKDLPVIREDVAFSDVPTTNTHYNNIHRAYCWGLTDGRADGTFGLGQKCTRAQAAGFIYKLNKALRNSHFERSIEGTGYKGVRSSRKRVVIQPARTDKNCYMNNGATNEFMVVDGLNELMQLTANKIVMNKLPSKGDILYLVKETDGNLDSVISLAEKATYTLQSFSSPAVYNYSMTGTYKRDVMKLASGSDWNVNFSLGYQRYNYCGESYIAVCFLGGKKPAAPSVTFAERYSTSTEDYKSTADRSIRVYDIYVRGSMVNIKAELDILGGSGNSTAIVENPSYFFDEKTGELCVKFAAMFNGPYNWSTTDRANNNKIQDVVKITTSYGTEITARLGALDYPGDWAQTWCFGGDTKKFVKALYNAETETITYVMSKAAYDDTFAPLPAENKDNLGQTDRRAAELLLRRMAYPTIRGIDPNRETMLLNREGAVYVVIDKGTGKAPVVVEFKNPDNIHYYNHKISSQIVDSGSDRYEQDLQGVVLGYWDQNKVKLPHDATGNNEVISQAKFLEMLMVNSYETLDTTYAVNEKTTVNSTRLELNVENGRMEAKKSPVKPIYNTPEIKPAEAEKLDKITAKNVAANEKAMVVWKALLGQFYAPGMPNNQFAYVRPEIFW